MSFGSGSTGLGIGEAPAALVPWTRSGIPPAVRTLRSEAITRSKTLTRRKLRSSASTKFHGALAVLVRANTSSAASRQPW